MSKKVLILSSSPRKGGNSDILCNQFLLGATESGHEVEKIFLKDKDINYCLSCGACFNSHKSCPQKDDAGDVVQKMIDADVIVMATPVYFYTMCAQMKVLIDRTCARYTEISNKDFYFIVTAADNSRPAMDRTIEGFRGFLDCLNDPRERGIVYGIGAWQVGDIKVNPAMEKALNMGRDI